MAFAIAAAPPELRFETIFTAGGEPARLHYHATYLAGGTTHFVEVWREGDKRLKRVTDGRITTIAVHAPGDEFGLTVVDPAKRVITTIDRTNLYRLGNFTDWFDLGHGLRHPKGTYRLVAAKAPAAVPFASCTWYDLTAATRTTHICWSRDVRLPLAIIGADGAPMWRITGIDRIVPGDAFRVVDHGFVHVDANRDLDRD